MEMKTMCFGDRSYPVLQVVEDGEMRMFLLTEIDPDALMYAIPVDMSSAAHFRYAN